ncbi:hypothetical protein BST34_28540 [Mycolicibacterium monacense DSM 44395]|nr:hypothetical protein BST34_28540 [Mycolicibacterium monacense DSM 44395]
MSRLSTARGPRWPRRGIQVSATAPARWTGRYRALGAGITDESQRPHRSPRRNSARNGVADHRGSGLRRWRPTHIGDLWDPIDNTTCRSRHGATSHEEDLGGC